MAIEWGGGEEVKHNTDHVELDKIHNTVYTPRFFDSSHFLFLDDDDECIKRQDIEGVL